MGVITTDISTVYFPKINHQGTVAGTSTISGWISACTHSYIWDQHSGYKDMQLPGSWDNCYTCSINNKGQILLHNGSPDKPEFRAAIWEKGTFHQIPTPLFNSVTKMNNQSKILGYINCTTMNGMFNYDIPTIYDYNTGDFIKLPFKDQAYGYDINEKGQVIGEFYNRQKNLWLGFLWDPIEGVTILNDFIPVCFNSNDQIIGKKGLILYLYDLKTFWNLNGITEPLLHNNRFLAGYSRNSQH